MIANPNAPNEKAKKKRREEKRREGKWRCIGKLERANRFATFIYTKGIAGSDKCQNCMLFG